MECCVNTRRDAGGRNELARIDPPLAEYPLHLRMRLLDHRQCIVVCGCGLADQHACVRNNQEVDGLAKRGVILSKRIVRNHTQPAWEERARDTLRRDDEQVVPAGGCNRFVRPSRSEISVAWLPVTTTAIGLSGSFAGGSGSDATDGGAAVWLATNARATPRPQRQ